MKKLIAAALTSAVALVPLTLPEAAEARGNASCITKAEYRKVKKGQSLAKVARIVGSKGKVSSDFSSGGLRMVTRDFKACSPFNRYSAVSITFDNIDNRFNRAPMAVDGKMAFWLHN